MSLSVAEQMAVAVLKGDMDAARMLADKLVDDIQNGVNELLPVKQIKTSVKNIRVAVYFPVTVDGHQVGVDLDNTREAVREWLEEGGPLVLLGADRIELYELPEKK